MFKESRFKTQLDETFWNDGFELLKNGNLK